ncbi:DUF6709 family protein [Flavobacterium sp. TBRC 19031]|uniref:DUF6709 family protein n=1 Tax=Flavobacterium mekongense TaxID=3379707 RepID=UPI00399BA47D
MNFETFKSILIKSNKRILLVSILIFLIGIPMAVGSWFANHNKAGLIISIIFILLGVFMLSKAIKDLKKIKNDTLPILYAIKNKQSDYIVWIYQKEIISKVEGVKVGKSNNIIVCSKDNKHIEFVLNNSISPESVISYLSNAFPNAYLGYTDENKKEVELLWKKNKN